MRTRADDDDIVHRLHPEDNQLARDDRNGTMGQETNEIENLFLAPAVEREESRMSAPPPFRSP